MDCENQRDIEKSRKIFRDAKNVKQFLQVWSSFYENVVCIPTYLSTFVSDKEDHDNIHATLKLGEKLKEITMAGIIPFDSQVTIPGEQKGYMLAYVPLNMAEKLTVELNRYSGIVAYYTINSEKLHDAEGLYVTYDGTDKEFKQGAKIGKLLGEPMTNIGKSDFTTLESIREWMSKPVRKIISHKNYAFLCVIAPDFYASSEFIFDCILNVVKKEF